MKKKEYPKLANGEIDYSKVDISNDFRDFPQLYSKVEDIENFILSRNCCFPVLNNLLKLRKEKKIDITPTEDKFYFDGLFHYIYDVFRVPTKKTYERVQDWLGYIERNLVYGGFSHVEGTAYNSVRQSFKVKIDMNDFYKEKNLGKFRDIKEINCFHDIGVNKEFYNSPSPKLIESFWIKCDKHVIQPIIVGDEAYARVHVYPERVYIFGCDDSSYSLLNTTEKEAKDFAFYLKCAAPVWNFKFIKVIHPKLEFTN